jgi:hypothetical protein
LIKMQLIFASNSFYERTHHKNFNFFHLKDFKINRIFKKPLTLFLKIGVSH